MNSFARAHRCPVLIFALATLALPAAESPKSASSAASAPAVSTEAMQKAGLTSAQLLAGLKTGLTTMVDRAGVELAKPGAVPVTAPDSMSKLEAALRKVNQSGAFDGFKATLSQTAASIAPQTTAALKAAIGPLTMDDASLVMSGAPDSATRVLRKSAESGLRTKLLPLVSKAMAANGTAAKAKELVTTAGPMAAMLGAPTTGDLENHVLTQVLESTFGYLAKQEMALRANPSLTKDALAAKVFSLGKK